jgi:hypothetical protein
MKRITFLLLAVAIFAGGVQLAGRELSSSRSTSNA